MTIRVTSAAFDPWQELRSGESAPGLGAGRHGAMASFLGTMRDLNEGRVVRGLILEHYPGMTERYLEKISREARQRWEILDALIVHRVGSVSPGEPIVLVAVWATHRAAAFDACRYLVENLKSRAPFWKKETRSDGEAWVERNTPGA